MTKLTQLAEWQALSAHKKTIAAMQMQDSFKNDSHRFNDFSIRFNGILFDYSKNRITKETINLLIKLAEAAQLPNKIKALFAGEMVNHSEKRAALHTALRSPITEHLLVNGIDIIPMIHATLDKMREFSEKVRNKTWSGSTGLPIRSIVNIGIGGSHLGPLMATHALKSFAHNNLECFFISNIDHAHVQEVLSKIDPATTLFVISSKSFTTLETMTNANTLRQWLQQKLGIVDIQKHFVAVTAAKKAALAFGIPDENIFTLWDWIGGRYSLCSAIGLPLAIMIGMDAFLEFLAGAHAMDKHFQHTEFANNIPVIMGLLGIWYINFFNTSHHAIIPYSHRLHYFRTHLQQLDMESNGKNISEQGDAVDFLTGPVILGEQGCNGQHAFHQLLHQGQHLIPVDFILAGADHTDLSLHQDILISSGLSQAQALMRGKTLNEAIQELHTEGYTKEECEQLAPHKVIPGNRPSNTLFLDTISPYNLGVLLALYEHKTFVQGAIWGINSFDQWGVELGKSLLPRILENLQHSHCPEPLDSSTQGLIHHYKKLRNQT